MNNSLNWIAENLIHGHLIHGLVYFIIYFINASLQIYSRKNVCVWTTKRKHISWCCDWFSSSCKNNNNSRINELKLHVKKKHTVHRLLIWLDLSSHVTVDHVKHIFQKKVFFSVLKERRGPLTASTYWLEESGTSIEMKLLLSLLSNLSFFCLFWVTVCLVFLFISVVLW